MSFEKAPSPGRTKLFTFKFIKSRRESLVTSRMQNPSPIGYIVSSAVSDEYQRLYYDNIERLEGYFIETKVFYVLAPLFFLFGNALNILSILVLMR